MRFDVLTLFPELFHSPLRYSILKRARIQGFLDVHLHNIRDFATDKRRTVDDIPYGGGAGMVMKPEPLFRCLEHVKKSNHGKVIFLTPDGKSLTHRRVQRLSRESELILLCGHYEGIDQRIRDHVVDEEISIGPYVLTGGELPALVLIDAVTRLIPGVLGKQESFEEESFSSALHGKKEYPHYTRPAVFKKWRIPQVLLSGHHEKIRQWRKKKLK